MSMNLAPFIGHDVSSNRLIRKQRHESNTFKNHTKNRESIAEFQVNFYETYKNCHQHDGCI